MQIKNSKYNIGFKLNKDNIKLLSRLNVDDNSTRIEELLSINNNYLPKDIILTQESDYYLILFYLRYKQDVVNISSDLSCIIDMQEYEDSTYDLIYSLGLDYSKINKSVYKNINEYNRYPIDNCLICLSELIMNNKLNKSDIDIIEYSNKYLSSILYSNYDLLLNSSKYDLLMDNFVNLSLVYLTNINKYNNSSIVRDALKYTLDNNLLVDNYKSSSNVLKRCK